MLRARSGKRDPLRPHEALARASKTLQLSLPGPGEGAGRQKVVAPGRASVEGWGEDRPRAANSQEKVTPPGVVWVEGKAGRERQAQARQASGHAPRTSPRPEGWGRRADPAGHCGSYQLQLSRLAIGVEPSSERDRPDQVKGRKGRVLARAQPSSHASRHTPDSLARSPLGSAQSPCPPSREHRAQAHTLSRRRGPCPFHLS